MNLIGFTCFNNSASEGQTWFKKTKTPKPVLFFFPLLLWGYLFGQINRNYKAVGGWEPTVYDCEDKKQY